MGEIKTLELDDTSEVATRALSIIEQARSVIVVDSESYTVGGEFYKAIRSTMKDVDKMFDKNIKRWHEGHKAAVAEKAEYYVPLEKASKEVKRILSDYDEAQERIRKAEEARLRKIAEEAEAKRLEEERKAEEERLLNEAIVAEAAGDTKVADAILEAPIAPPEPVFTPAPIVPKSTPKISGVSYRTIWSAEVVDISLIPRKYLAPDMVMLNKIASAEKERMSVPGIKPVSRRV